MRKLIFIVMILNGCVSSTEGEYNTKRKQDPDCYKSLGGQPGYCDMPWWKYEQDPTK